jgi:hypothetical protein
MKRPGRLLFFGVLPAELENLILNQDSASPLRAEPALAAVPGAE